MNEEKIIDLLINHEERLIRIEENMATKEDIRGIHEVMDVILKNTKRNEQEIIMMGQRVSCNERDIAELRLSYNSQINIASTQHFVTPNTAGNTI